MLSLPESIRIFLRREKTDMRLGFQGLACLAQNVFGQNPTSGHLFVFVNERRNRAKMLLWDRGGFWLLSRKLEQGTFVLPALASDGNPVVDAIEWAAFLEGVTMDIAHRKKRYRLPP